MNLSEKIKARIQSGVFNFQMRMNQKRGMPAQTRQEIRLFKEIFNFVCSDHKTIRIFEWGSGYSSIYYARYLSGRTKFQWHSIDNNPGWHMKVKEMAAEDGLEEVTRFYKKEFPPFWEKPGWGEIPPPCGRFAPQLPAEIEYIQLPIELDIKFNVVIVDARFRRRCLETARHILTDDGIVILHDAQKPQYQEGIDQYPHHAFLSTGAWYPFQDPQNKVWVGSFGNARQIDEWRIEWTK